MGNFLNEFVRCSDTQPCPICGKPDWCCISSAGNFALCHRIQSRVSWGEAGYYHDIQGKPIRVVVRKEYTPKPKVAAEIVDAFMREARDRLHPKQVIHLGKQLGVADLTLSRLGMGWFENKYCFPMKDGYGNEIGVRYRYMNGGKATMDGSVEGIFYPWPFITRKDQPVFITEGPTDCAALLSLDPRLSCIGKPTCRTGNQHIINLLTGREFSSIVIVADPDRVGLKGAMKTLDILGEKFPVVQIIRPKGYSDARECCKHQFDSQDIIGCVNKAHSNFWELSMATATNLESPSIVPWAAATQDGSDYIFPLNRTLRALDIWADGSVMVEDIEGNQVTRTFTAPYRWVLQIKKVLDTGGSTTVDIADMDALH